MLKKVFVVFPVFIFFAFSGLFVFASPSSPVFFQCQPQVLTNEQKQDLTWEQIKSELRNTYIYLDFPSDWKSLLDAAKNDAQYEKKGFELEQEVKIWLLDIFAGIKSTKTGVLEFLLKNWTISLREQKSRWNSLVDAGVGEKHIDALLNPQYAYLVKTQISIKKEGKEIYKVSLEPSFLAAKRFRFLETAEEFVKIKIPGFREMIWDFHYLFSVGEREINAALTTVDDEKNPN